DIKRAVRTRRDADRAVFGLGGAAVTRRRTGKAIGEHGSGSNFAAPVEGQEGDVVAVIAACPFRTGAAMKGDKSAAAISARKLAAVIKDQVQRRAMARQQGYRLGIAACL